jgi:UDP-4-amino-4,6-dideoxy-N-acetyl-beta-L-altrosamine transaminase
MINYGRQSIDQTDIDAVTSVLFSDFLTQGPVVGRFEQALCEYTGAASAVACSNGTAALHLACLALGVSAGDKVWTVSNTFVASANCALYCGADIEFVDIDPDSFNVSVELLASKLAIAAKEGTLPKVLIVVHFAGESCDMKAISLLANAYEIKVIEDAAHALGGSYLGEKVGRCRYSDITTFSFHPVKSITAAEGGAVLTNDKIIYETVKCLAGHGIERNSERFINPSTNRFYYEQQLLGYNYRLSDVHAALGLSQLSRLDSFVRRRIEIAALYKEKLHDQNLKYQKLSAVSTSAFHLFTILLDDSLRDRRDEFVNLMWESNIAVGCHYIPVHTQPFYVSALGKSFSLPTTQDFYSRCISLPIYPSLSQGEQLYICDAVRENVQKIL